MKRPGLDPLSIDYEMEQQNSIWRVHDMKIAGVSLLATYREAFGSTVRETGIDGPAKNFPLMFAIVQMIIQTVR